MKLRDPLALIWKSVDGLSNRNGIEIAGYIAFTIMLSLFPFMIFLVSVAGFFGDTHTGDERAHIDFKVIEHKNAANEGEEHHEQPAERGDERPCPSFDRFRAFAT